VTTARGKNRPAVSVRWLLLGVNGLVVLVPLLAVLGLKLYQNHLIAQTETNLIGQAVVIGEIWRSLYLDERGEAPGSRSRADLMPPRARDERFAPVEPVIDLGDGVSPPLAGPSREAASRGGPAFRSGQRMTRLLERAQAFNLSSARILDPEGCTVASTGEWANGCFDDYEEINAALEGRYRAVARERQSDEPAPPLASISRRGDVRVFVALPIFDRGEVVAAVWMSRTSMAPLKAAWLNRRPLTAALLLTVIVTVLVSLFLSRTITRPLGRITGTAKAVASGKGLEPGRVRFAPREVRELEDALRRMAEQLSGRARYIADYAANASHELKSPITAIRGAAELLLEEGDEMGAEQRRRFIANIESDASRMERLVTRMLELARIESDPDEGVEVNLPSFITQVARSYGSRVELSLDEPPEAMIISRDHLETALRNLIDNGIRVSAGAAVQVSAASRDGRLVVEVRDRGPGIDEAHAERIFERFFTTERDSGGTGLGLSIVRAVARSRGGDVSFEAWEEGTVFTLVI